MKVTKLFLTLLAIYLIVSCNSDELIENKLYNRDAYVRFHLVLDSDGQPFEGEIDNRKMIYDIINQSSLKILKIPVALTYPNLEKEVTVDFETYSTGDYSGFTISPEGQLSFNPNKFVDTIYIEFNERWDASDNEQILLQLTKASDPDIHIGSLNDTFPNDEMTISLTDIVTTFTLATNRIEIEGVTGEQHEFEVLFPEGLFASEIAPENLFSVDTGFVYSLEVAPYETGDTKLTFTLTIEEDINNDYYSYQTVFSLNAQGKYTPIGNTIMQVVKPVVIERDKSVNPAGNFYNLADRYYRTYGENWLFDSNDEACEWKPFNAFTFPVVVDADHPAAILYDDMGTTEPDDDIYHHAFRIGFNTIVAGNTVNSFNLKRWFSNESISEENSPGFNITEALEFFPDEGNSATSGTVSVVSQFLTIAGKNGNSYSIGISGEGTYTEIEPGIFEIILELHAENQELFGGTRVAYYRIYNTNTYEDPEPLNDVPCIEEMDL